MSIKQNKNIVIRIAGDSGDGIQVIGNQLAENLSKKGVFSKTMPDFPAEIRAPAGTLHGISGFQIAFSDEIVYTPGDELDVLVALNPAAVVKNIVDLKDGGLLIVDNNKFTSKELSRLKVEDNYLDLISNRYQILKIDITDITINSTNEFNLTRPQAIKCRNMFSLGLIYWIYNIDLNQTKLWIQNKYKNKPGVAEANISALQAGYNFAITLEISQQGIFSNNTSSNLSAIHINGNKAFALAISYAALLFKKSVMLSGYPITPSSDIIHEVAKYSFSNIYCIQAEDEIAAACMALGASYGGNIGVTCTSGPGLDLKGESIGLGVMAELPLIVIDVQRSGPSTGMPTKNEQSDLLAAIYGRHGESPVIVLAACSPSDCFNTFLEACYLSLKMMMPVIVLSDAFLANSSEAWVRPDVNYLEKIFNIQDISFSNDRNNDFVRYPATPGTENITRRIGGLEKDIDTDNISYDPCNHQAMVELRQNKLNLSSKYFQPLIFHNNLSDKSLLITWGSSYGPCLQAVNILKESGIKIDLVCLRHLNPLHNQLENIIHNYNKIFVCELNLGQLSSLIVDKFNVKVIRINKVTGQLFKVHEIISNVEKHLC